jgi:hypothetical protein
MAKVSRNSRRSSRHESAQARVVLGKIWKKAFLENKVDFKFKPERLGAAKNLHTQLADYRKHVRQHRLTMLEEWGRVSSVSLILVDEFTVLLERKTVDKVRRAHQMLTLGVEFPEMELDEPNHINPISMIVKNFTTIPQLDDNSEP